MYATKVCILKVGWTVYCKQEGMNQGVYTKGMGIGVVCTFYCDVLKLLGTILIFDFF